MPIEITSDGGKIFNFEWYNSIPSIDLTKSSFDSICGRYSIAKAFRQYGFCCYWGGITLGKCRVRTKMILSGIAWIFLEVPSPLSVISRDGGQVVITDVKINGETYGSQRQLGVSYD
jgi:hypothetical protein